MFDRFPDMIVFTMQVGGESKVWHYHIDWYKDPALMESIVTVRSKPRDTNPDKNLRITSWTNFDSSSISISHSSSPLILYTKVSGVSLLSVPIPGISRL